MSAPADTALESVLSPRIAGIPEALFTAAAAPPPPGIERIAAARRFVVTGGGLSEGPARVLVALLGRAGRPARFMPLSSFVATSGCKPQADTALILFSQGLAPNARLPLFHFRSFAETLVITSVSAAASPGPGPASAPAIRAGFAARGVAFWEHPPACEDKLLIRVVGPALALLCVLRLLSLLTTGKDPPPKALMALPVRYAASLFGDRGADLFGERRRPIALIAGEDLHELMFPLRWKLLEGLRVPDPPVWDFLQVVHGPLQAFYEEPLTLLAFEDATRPHEHELVERLSTLLHPLRHRLVRLPVEGAAGEALFYLDARLNAALVQTLRTHPLDLTDWPHKGKDGALYSVDATTFALPGRPLPDELSST